MQIKVCGLAVCQNISEVLQLTPGYAGFIFYKKSSRYIGGDASLKEAIRSIDQTKKVGVFVNAHEETIKRAIDEYRLNLVQLHGDESPSFCSTIDGIVPVIKAFQIGRTLDLALLKTYLNSCTYFLFDTASLTYGGSGKSFNWSLLDEYTLEVPFFLSGGISPDHAALIKTLSHPKLHAVDINSRFETSAGIKNIQLVKSFIHEVQH